MVIDFIGNKKLLTLQRFRYKVPNTISFSYKAYLVKAYNNAVN